MALLEEPPTGWLFNALAGFASALWTIVMILIGLLWKNQNKKIDDMKIAHTVALRDIRQDVEKKHTENREDILQLHADIKNSDERAQNRHNEIMIHLRDRSNGPVLRERY